MTQSDRPIPPPSFWIISLAGLVWNVFGLIAFVMQMVMSNGALAQLPEAERALYEAMPAWVNYAFAIAVISGTMGCLAMIMKKSWAYKAFLAALIAVIAQASYTLLISDAPEVYGNKSAIMPIVVLVIAAFLLLYSKSTIKKGWLN